MYVLAGDFHQARRALQAGMEIHSQDPSVWVVKTFLAWKEGNLVEARESLQETLRLGGNPPDVGAYLYALWGRAADVGQLLSALRDASG